MNTSTREKTFIDRDKLYSLVEGAPPTPAELDEILNRSLRMKGLGFEDVARASAC